MTNDAMIKGMFDMLKTSSEVAWGTVSMLHAQTERMAGMMVEQYDHLNAESRKYMDEWLSSSRQSYETWKRMYDEGLDKLAQVMPAVPQDTVRVKASKIQKAEA